MFDEVGFLDKIEVELIRNGKVAERRVTAKKTPLHQMTAKILRLFGVKLYADDLITNAGIERLASWIKGTYPSVSGESIGTGDDATTTFNATLAKTPVIPGSVSVTDGTETFTDNGDGTLTGSAGGSGTVNYTTGALSVTFNAAPSNGASITADYSYNGYYRYIAIGTDDGTTLALDATNTSLGNETHREAATVSLETTNVTNDTAVFEAMFNFASSYAITESGVFDAASGGNMLCRQTFAPINVADGDSLIVRWKITVS